MKHGIKLRKLGRTSSHRYALLRNLVSALLHHEQIQTTVPKAKEAARMAEKMITLGKKGTENSKRVAQAFLMPPHHYAPSGSSLPVPPPTSDFYPSLLPKLFSTLPSRYSTRPGGYTRITKFGRRPGDNAPQCLLSLVDGPRDVKAEMVARAVGREGVDWDLPRQSTREALGDLIKKAGSEARSAADKGKGREDAEYWRGLKDYTKRNVLKVLKYKNAQEVKEFEHRAKSWADTLIAAPQVKESLLSSYRQPGSIAASSGLGVARGALGGKAPGGEERRRRTQEYAASRQQAPSADRAWA